MNSDSIINIRSCTIMHVVRYTAQKMKSPCPRMDLVIGCGEESAASRNPVKNQFSPVDISRDFILTVRVQLHLEM